MGRRKKPTLLSRRGKLRRRDAKRRGGEILTRLESLEKTVMGLVSKQYAQPVVDDFGTSEE